MENWLQEGVAVMRSVIYKIARFPSIEEVQEQSKEMRDKKLPQTIEVTLVPDGGDAEFIVDVDIEMMNVCDHRVGVPRGQMMPDGKTVSRGGRNCWKWETTVNVYGSTKFPGFGSGDVRTTIDLTYHMVAQSGEFEAKITNSAAA